MLLPSCTEKKLTHTLYFKNIVSHFRKMIQETKLETHTQNKNKKTETFPRGEAKTCLKSKLTTKKESM